MSTDTNPVRGWLRLEALTVFSGSLMVWAALSGGWLRLLLLFLVPDISLVGYLVGPRVGAFAYNLVHSYVLPLGLGLAGGMLDNRSMLLASTLWLAHIGFDRALGLGLKYPTSFRETHLGRIGAPSLPDVARAKNAVLPEGARFSVTESVRQPGYSSAGTP